MKFNSLNVFDMITNEMKAKIAAMYLGCEVQTPDGIGSFWSVGTDGWIYAKCEGMQSEEYRCDEYQLILTPLSEITDEDAIEVAKIVSSGMNCIRYERKLNGSHWCYVRLINTNAEVRIWFNSGKITFCNVYQNSVTTLDGNFLPAYDFLRSKGYAIPAFGIDLFESGIAIPNNKTK